VGPTYLILDGYGSFFHERLNHLGNVQVVISDKRVNICDEYLGVERFEAEVPSAVQCTTHDKSTENRDEYSFLPEF